MAAQTANVLPCTQSGRSHQPSGKLMSQPNKMHYLMSPINTRGFLPGALGNPTAIQPQFNLECWQPQSPYPGAWTSSFALHANTVPGAVLCTAPPPPSPPCMCPRLRGLDVRPRLRGVHSRTERHPRRWHATCMSGHTKRRGTRRAWHTHGSWPSPPPTPPSPLYRRALRGRLEEGQRRRGDPLLALCGAVGGQRPRGRAAPMALRACT